MLLLSQRMGGMVGWVRLLSRGKPQEAARSCAEPAALLPSALCSGDSGAERFGSYEPMASCACILQGVGHGGTAFPLPHGSGVKHC